MSADLRDLLHATAEGPDEPVDPHALIAAGRRRRRTRHAVVGLGSVAAAALVTVLVGAQMNAAQPPVDIVDRPTPTVSASASEATPAGDGTSLGPVLDLETFPALGEAGVAIDTGSAVVFVDREGTLHGHLPGWRLNTGGPDRLVAGPVSLHSGDGVERVWVAPTDGSVHREADDLLWAPMIGAFEVAGTATGRDPSSLGLTGPDGAITQFSANLPNRVSDGHRVASWVSCPEGSSDGLDGCTWHAYDTATGETLDLPDGCAVADTFDDLVVLLECARTWTGGDGEVWLEHRGSTGDWRIDPFDDSGRFVNGFDARDDRMYATWEWPSADGCARRQVLGVRGTEVIEPLAVAADDGASMVIGVADEELAFVVDVDASCFGDAPSAGRVRSIDQDDTARLLYEGPLVHAEAWDPSISFARPEADPTGPSQSPADAERDGSAVRRRHGSVRSLRRPGRRRTR